MRSRVDIEMPRVVIFSRSLGGLKSMLYTVCGESPLHQNQAKACILDGDDELDGIRVEQQAWQHADCKIVD